MGRGIDAERYGDREMKAVRGRSLLCSVCLFRVKEGAEPEELRQKMLVGCEWRKPHAMLGTGDGVNSCSREEQIW